MTKQNNTPEIKPPEWLINIEKKKEEWVAFTKRQQAIILDRTEELRDEYGADSPSKIYGLHSLGA